MLTDEQIEEMQLARDVLEGLRSLVKSPGWAQAVRLIEANCKARENQLGQQPTIDMEEALRKNYEIGIIHGLKLVPTIIVTAGKTASETYKSLLAIQQGVDE